MILAVMNAIYAIAYVEAFFFQASTYAIALIEFITARIIAYLISHPQFNMRNISYITSQKIVKAVMDHAQI